MPRVDVTVIVPAYNEVRSIGGTLDEIVVYFDQKGLGVEVIVVVDGDDGTAGLVAERARQDRRLLLIASRASRGKGSAIRDGVAVAHGDVIGFVDADNKTPISEYDKVLPHLSGASATEVVIGSRGIAGSRIERSQPLHRRLGSMAFAAVMHTLVGLRGIADTQCGFKFFRADVARDLFARQRIDGYMFDVEILQLATRAGYRIVQVPVRWRDDGDSRLRLVAGNLRNAVDLLRIAASRFV